MKEKRIKLIDWQRLFNSGFFASGDFDTQVKAGWYDWFCNDASLANKTQKMGNIIKQIKEGGKIDLNKTYAWFKNNCPYGHPLYDDFRIADLETVDTLFCVAINCGYEKSRYAVYTASNGWETPEFETDFSRELVKWFNTPR